MNLKYDFVKVDDHEVSKQEEMLFEIGYLKGHPEVRCLGSMITLFGKPNVMKKQLDEMFYYSIKGKGIDGKEVALSVSASKAGPMILAHTRNGVEIEAAEELLHRIKSTPPADFAYEGSCLDGELGIECGIRDGRIYYVEREHLPLTNN